MDKKVELQVINITNSQAQVGAFAMLLGEVDGEGNCLSSSVQRKPRLPLYI